MNLKDQFIVLTQQNAGDAEVSTEFKEWQDKGEEAISNIAQRQSTVAVHMAVGMNMPEGDPYKEFTDILKESIANLTRIKEDSIPYEIFAISEGGTENVDFADSDVEAKDKVIKLVNLLRDGKWINDTSLTGVVGFNYDRGPGNE